jgi:hypothetical protein
VLWSFIAFFGCAPVDVDATAVDAAPPPAPLQLAWEHTGLADGRASWAHVTGWPPGVAGTVVLVGSRAQQVPPVCVGPGSACREVATPYVEVGRDTFATTEWRSTFQVEPGDFGWQPGDSVVLQAILLGPDGRAWASSNPLIDVVDPTRKGCTFPHSPDYDPLAEVDNGCACPWVVTATTQAELDAYAECTVLSTVLLNDWAEASVSLPKLERASRVELRTSVAVEQIHLPRLTASYQRGVRIRVEIGDTPALRDLDLSSLQVGELTLSEAPALGALDLPALEYGTLWLTRTGTPSITLPVMKRGDLTLNTLAALASLHAPLLTVAGTVQLQSTGLTGPLALPSLRQVGHLQVDNDPTLTGLQAPVLQSLGTLEIYQLPSLSDLSLPAVETARTLEIFDLDALTTFAAPALHTLNVLYLGDNLTLSALDLAALADTDWIAQIEGNPALCVTDTPQLLAPPPGCTVDGTDNLCDP